MLTNQSSGNYNYDVQQAINRFKVYEDNGNWFRLYNAYDPKEADFTVELVVRTIEAYPDKVTTNRYEETKEIQDGFEFLYDAQGHIVKDSLGNPIKVPDYKTVSVFVTETWQEKIATMSGEILYKDANGRVMRSIPVRSDAVFQNYYATATGYYEALSAQSKQKIGGQPIPFPSENTLLLDAVKQMECNVNDVLEDYNDEYLNR